MAHVLPVLRAARNFAPPVARWTRKGDNDSLAHGRKLDGAAATIVPPYGTAHGGTNELAEAGARRQPNTRLGATGRRGFKFTHRAATRLHQRACPYYGRDMALEQTLSIHPDEDLENPWRIDVARTLSVTDGPLISLSVTENADMVTSVQNTQTAVLREAEARHLLEALERALAAD